MVVKKDVNWVVSSFRLRGFVAARVATDFQSIHRKLPVMVSWRNFLGSKGTIGCCFSEKNIDLLFKVSYRLLEVKELLSSHHRWHRPGVTTRTVRNIVTKKGLLENS